MPAYTLFGFGDWARLKKLLPTAQTSPAMLELIPAISTVYVRLLCTFHKSNADISLTTFQDFFG